jgi:hypothetical protein
VAHKAGQADLANHIAKRYGDLEQFGILHDALARFDIASGEAQQRATVQRLDMIYSTTLIMNSPRRNTQKLAGMSNLDMSHNTNSTTPKGYGTNRVKN